MSSFMSMNDSIFRPRVVSVTPTQTSQSSVVPGGQNNAASIAASYSDAQNKANVANEARYQQGLKLQNQRVKLANQMGQANTERINQQYATDTGRTEQQAVSRGLGNTTIRNALLSQDARRRDSALLANSEAVAGVKSGALQDMTNFIANRDDLAPDANAAANLVSQAAQGASASGTSLASIATALGLQNQLLRR